MDFITYPDREMQTLMLADRLANALAQHLRTNDRAVLCVPGGSTPAPVFDALAASALDWGRVTVVAGDERWVPGDHRRSNGRLIRRHLLQGPAQAAHYLDLYTGAARPEDAAPDLAARLAGLLPVTVALLGMGADMHTASLFPGADGLAQALAPDAAPVMAMRPPGADEPRITLTAPVLGGALWRHLLITGDDKRAALDRAAGLTPREAPIRAFFDDLTVHWAA